MFLERHPASPPFRLLPMQGEEGSALLIAHGINPQDPTTFLVVDAGRAYRESDGAIHVVTALGGIWRSAGLAKLIPRALRDVLYRMVARNRYRLFGRRTVCYLPGTKL
jgi:predicted DCC family thiol-disulfide oxidoreductase YuxK